MSKASEKTRTTGARETYGFPKRLKKLVEAHGSVSQYASESGVSEGVLRKYMKGESLPSLDRLVAIADTGRVSIDWLARGDGESDSEGLAAPLVSGQHEAEERAAQVIAGLTQQQLNVLDEFRRYVERAVCDHGSDSSVAELADEFERQYNTGSGALRGEGIIAVSGVERVSAPALLESLKAIDSLNAGYRVPVQLASRLDVNRFHFRPVLFRDVTKALEELGHEVNETEDLDVVAHALIVAASRGEKKLVRVPRELISKLLELLVFLRR